MTEEDTFKALCKPSYGDLHEKWKKYIIDRNHRIDLDLEFTNFLNRNGWTREEHSEEHYRRLRNRDD